VRDAMGTVYGVAHLQELFTATFIASFVFAPLYSGLASRLKLSTFLPWVYGFVAVTILLFYALFVSGKYQDHWIAAGFYVWVSTFNMLIISVFWTFMADIFSRTQAKRLFGFVAAGGTIGGIVGPAIATFLATRVGNSNLLLISSAGFGVTAVLVRMLAAEKRKLLAEGVEAQPTSLEHRLKGNPFDGFRLLLRSRYLLLLAVFLLLMTWISTIVYFQLGDLITKAFASREARTQAYATIDLTVNSWYRAHHRAFRRQHGLTVEPHHYGRCFSRDRVFACSPSARRRSDRAPCCRICRRQADARNALHCGRPRKSIQSEERHRYSGLSVRRLQLCVGQCRNPALWLGWARNLRRDCFRDLVSSRLPAGQGV